TFASPASPPSPPPPDPSALASLLSALVFPKNKHGPGTRRGRRSISTRYSPLPAAAAAAATAPAPPTPAAPPPRGLGPRLVHVELPAAELGAVQGSDRGLRLRCVVHLHEPESAGPPRVPVHDERRRRHGAVLLERLAQLGLGGLERQVPDV